MAAAGHAGYLEQPAIDRVRSYVMEAMRLLEEKHINSSKVNWKEIHKEMNERIQNADDFDDTYDDIRWLIEKLGEKHSFLIEPSQFDVKAGEKVKADKNIDLPKVAETKNKVTRIIVPSLNTFEHRGQDFGVLYEKTLRNIISDNRRRSSCGWIIDLRFNEGGNMWPMLNGLGPILGPSPFGYFLLKGDEVIPWVRQNGRIVTAFGNGPSTQKIDPPELPPPAIAVLLGPQTSSSGEMVAIAFAGRANSKSFGMPSSGFTTANMPHRLADGALLVITETYVADRLRRKIEGPIVPDVQVSDHKILKTARGWLSENCKRNSI